MMKKVLKKAASRRLGFLSGALFVAGFFLCSFWGGEEKLKTSQPTCELQPFDEPTPALVSLSAKAIQRQQGWDQENSASAPSLLNVIDHNSLAQIAKSASQVKRFKKSRGLCMRGVRIALNRAFSRDPNRWPFSFEDLNDDQISLQQTKISSPTRSAETFYKWAKANPVSLCRNLGLADVNDIQDLLPNKKGLIHLYSKGECGFSPRYGHIEVIVDNESKEACSDHCRRVSESRSECKPSLVLAPVNNCDFLLTQDKKLPELQEANKPYCRGNNATAWNVNGSVVTNRMVL